MIIKTNSSNAVKPFEVTATMGISVLLLVAAIANMAIFHIHIPFFN